MKKLLLTAVISALLVVPLMAQGKPALSKGNKALRKGATKQCSNKGSKAKTDAKAKAAKARADAKAKGEKAKEKYAAHRSDRRNKGVDKRQDKQDTRMERGVENGSLTGTEIAGLATKAKSIETMQVSFNGDGNLSHNEAKNLHSLLNDLSKDIFFEKHDTQGHQMAVRRHGKGRSVYLSKEVTDKFEAGNLSKAEATKITSDMRRMCMMKTMLTSKKVSMSTGKRESLKKEYDELLGKYYTQGEKEELSTGEKARRAERKEKWDTLSDEEKAAKKTKWEEAKENKAERLWEYENMSKKDQAAVRRFNSFVKIENLTKAEIEKIKGFLTKVKAGKRVYAVKKILENKEGFLKKLRAEKAKKTKKAKKDKVELPEGGVTVTE